MRDLYPLTLFFESMAAWEKHKLQYLDSLEKSRQPKPTKNALRAYQQTWIEGWLEARMDYAEIDQQQAEEAAS